MRLDGLSAADIVTTVFSYYQPRTHWDADRLRDSMDAKRLPEPPRLYCPDCGNLNSLQLGMVAVRDASGKAIPGMQAMRWLCGSCNGQFDPVKVNRRRSHGTIDAQQTRSTKRDNDWQIIDGLIAGKVMAAVDRLEPPARAWAYWAHTPLGTTAHRATVFDHAVGAVDAQAFRAETLREAGKALEVVLRVIESAASPATTVSRSDLALVAGVNRAQFSGRRWGGLVTAVGAALADLERQMADSVLSALVREVA